MDATGNVYVADTYNHRIQKFSISGSFLAKWGSDVSGDGQFNLPKGIAVDASGNVYVSDTGNSRIQKFSSSGAFLTKWGSSGSGDGQFKSPQGAAVDASGNVYVSDWDNSRIQVFGVPAAPSADFVGVGAVSGAQTVAAGETVNFTDTSTNSPTSWAWDFNNDGVTDSTLRNPTNVYTVAGTYSVKLTATNSGGSGNTTKTNYITVTPGALHHITVIPSHPTVGITASQTFTATGFDQFNNARTGDTFTWSVAGASAAAGAFNATTGVFTATSNLANIADYADAIARRPSFKRLLEDAARGQFDIVVVHSLDRWARNQRVMLESLATLGRHNVSLASITENIDYSNPQGKLFTQMLGSFAEYFSAALGKHVSKGLDQRAHEGKHTGGIPFGYQSCWAEGEKGEKICRCSPEHKGGIHVHETEGPAVSELFARYASGTTTLSQLAAWLNSEGFRTRNMHRLPDGEGNLTSGPRLFTTASVRGILHNPFYTGKVQYKGKLLPGAHEPLVTPETFEQVQAAMRKNSGRSESLAVRPEREYLLKGIVRCAYCGMPMWAQTYKSGQRYYREHQGTRSKEVCPSKGGAITCHVPDDQIGKVVEAIELGPRWLEEVLAIVNVADEVARVKKERENVQEKLRRMAKAYIDGLFPDEEYKRQKRLLEMDLESLVVPQANAAEEAGKLIQDLPRLWAEANLAERRKLLLSMLDAVYVDAKEEKRIVGIKPKPPFMPVFQVATTKEGSGVVLLKEPPVDSPEAPCLWWRRGRVEQYLKHGAVVWIVPSSARALPQVLLSVA